MRIWIIMLLVIGTLGCQTNIRQASNPQKSVVLRGQSDTKSGGPKEVILKMQMAIVDNNKEAFLKCFDVPSKDGGYFRSLFSFMRASYEFDCTLQKKFSRKDIDKTVLFKDFQKFFFWSEEWFKEGKFIQKEGRAIFVNDGVEWFLTKKSDGRWLIEVPLPGITRWTSDLSLDKKRQKEAYLGSFSYLSLEQPVYDQKMVGIAREKEAEALTTATTSFERIEKIVDTSGYDLEKLQEEVMEVFVNLMGGNF